MKTLIISKLLFLYSIGLQADLIPQNQLLSKQKLGILSENQMYRYINAITIDIHNYESALEEKKVTSSWEDWLFFINKATANENKYCIHNATIKVVNHGCNERDGYSFDTNTALSTKVLSKTGFNIDCPSTKEAPCGIMAGITSASGLLCSQDGTSYCLKKGIELNAQRRLAAALTKCFAKGRTHHNAEIKLPMSNNSKVKCRPLISAFTTEYLQLKNFCSSKNTHKRRALSRVCEETYRAAINIWNDVQRRKAGISEVEDFVCNHDRFKLGHETNCIVEEIEQKAGVKDFIGNSKNILNKIYKCIKTDDMSRKAQSFSPIDGYVCTDSSPLNMRSEGSSFGNRITSIPRKEDITILGKRNEQNYVKIRWDNKEGFVHSSYICNKPKRKQRNILDEGILLASTSTVGLLPPVAKTRRNKTPSPSSYLTRVSPEKETYTAEASDYDYIQGSKCDHRKHAGQYSFKGLGDRKAFLDKCYSANGTSKRICMDMTCPNTGASQREVFGRLFPGDVSYQMIPPNKEHKYGVRLAKIVSRLERNGACISDVTNWHRPGAYNDAVGGAPSSMHKTQGGGKAVDIYTCSTADRSKAVRLINKWSPNGRWPGGLGTYSDGRTIHLDLRGYEARW